MKFILPTNLVSLVNNNSKMAIECRSNKHFIYQFSKELYTSYYTVQNCVNFLFLGWKSLTAKPNLFYPVS